MNKAFNDAVMITLDRDDIDQIKANSHKFFISLPNKSILIHFLPISVHLYCKSSLITLF